MGVFGQIVGKESNSFTKDVGGFQVSALQAEERSGSTQVREHIRIEPSSGWIPLNLKELWEYRELIFYFVWRDLKVRYKQTVVGAGWAVIQPIFTMVVFSIFFGQLAKLPSDGVPYPIFSFAALVPWGYFVNVMSGTASSMLTNASMIKKVYFPRLAIPLSHVFSAGVDFAIQFAVLLLMMLYYKISPTADIVWLPLFVLLAVVTSTGVGLWLATYSARYRDLRYIQNFLVQSWLFITPIAYSSSLLNEPWKTLYGINPMAGVVEGFRWALLGTDTSPGLMVVVSALVAVIVFVSGLYKFQQLEKTFADII
jgi:lipopolysaccharide transport system permease protein